MARRNPNNVIVPPGPPLFTTLCLGGQALYAGLFVFGAIRGAATSPLGFLAVGVALMWAVPCIVAAYGIYKSRWWGYLLEAPVLWVGLIGAVLLDRRRNEAGLPFFTTDTVLRLAILALGTIFLLRTALMLYRQNARAAA